jgi:hypothetical protein
MNAKSIHDYFFFGTAVRYLEDASVQHPIQDTKSGSGVLTNLKRVLKALNDLGLHVSSRAAGGLKAIETELAGVEGNTHLTKDQAQRLQTEIEKFRLTLEAEIRGFEAYVLTPKRIDVRRLIAEVPTLFAPGTFLLLPTIATLDLNEAGKCIAFERPTAAAFHLLRATESVLREVYLRTIKRNRVSLMWGPMIQHLKSRRLLKGDESLLNNLDDIRLYFRNPTQHPEKVYDIEEVQDLWGRCVDVINRMSKYLK